MTRCVQRPDDDVADLDLASVLERLVRERRLRSRVHANRDVELESEPAVAGDVIGMRVRLQDGDEVDAMAFALVKILLDRIRGIDDDGSSRLIVADQV